MPNKILRITKLAITAKQYLSSTNQNLEDEWQRFVPPLIFWAYLLSKICFAILPL